MSISVDRRMILFRRLSLSICLSDCQRDCVMANFFPSNRAASIWIVIDKRIILGVYGEVHKTPPKHTKGGDG